MGLVELVNKYSGYFIVNYENFEVIYTQGYQNSNGLWCYKITELNKAPSINEVPVTPITNETTELNEVTDTNEIIESN